MSASRWILCLPGTLLLLAAALKTWGLGVDPVGRTGWFSMPEVQLAIIEFEIVLGVWLLSGWNPIASWGVALVTFTIFAATTFYQGMVGQTSCGCFGQLSTSPWIAFGIDLAILALLAIGRPDFVPLHENRLQIFISTLRPLALAAIGVAIITTLLLVAANASFGSLPAALAYIRGERVSVSPRLADVGEGVEGDARHVDVQITNWTAKPVRLFGGTADCSCTVLGDLPLSIGPGEMHKVTVDLRMKGKAGIFTRQVKFLIDDEGYKTVPFSITGRILDARE